MFYEDLKKLRPVRIQTLLRSEAQNVCAHGRGCERPSREDTSQKRAALKTERCRSDSANTRNTGANIAPSFT
jgi:hypothetical protein